jgi:apolipoprotein N-acyltransferase
MEHERSKIVRQAPASSYLWLASAAVFLLFSNGRWVIPLAAWLFSPMMIRFLREQRPLRGLALGAITFVLAGLITNSGTREIFPGMSYFPVAAACSLLFFLPFVADRLIAHRVRGILATFVFPLAGTTTEFVFSFLGFGTWGALAYTQYGNLPLVQIVSITGISGLGFLIAWFASVINWVWEEEFRWPNIRHVICLYFGILGAVLLLGGARLALFPPESNTVRVATITTRRDLGSPDRDIFYRLFARKANGQSLQTLDTEAFDDFLGRSRDTARFGAKIIVWAECAVPVPKEKEVAFIERGCQLARDEKIYLMMALYAVPLGFPEQLWENKVVVIGPTGDVVCTYLKRHRPPGEPMVLGDRKLPVVNTPYGKISTAICIDTYFPNFVRQAGKAGVNLMFTPSKSWKGITPQFTYAATFRAVENGFSLVDCVNDGLSIAVDYHGRTVAAANYFTSNEQVMIADVPMKGVTTIYSQIGDFFAWCCIIGLASIFLWTIVFRPFLEFRGTMCNV